MKHFKYNYIFFDNYKSENDKSKIILKKGEKVEIYPVYDLGRLGNYKMKCEITKIRNNYGDVIVNVKKPMINILSVVLLMAIITYFVFGYIFSLIEIGIGIVVILMFRIKILADTKKLVNRLYVI